MRVLITHAYSTENKGDAALLDVLIQDIHRQYGADCMVDILTIDKVSPGTRFADTPLHQAFMYYALNSPKTRVGKLLYASTMMSYTLIWASCVRHLGIRLPLPRTWSDVMRRYETADIIITVGGGYFRTGGDVVTFINLLLMLHPLKLAEIIKKPTFLYTMSVGPFYSNFEKMLVKSRFKRASLILIREDISMKLLASMGISQNVTRSVDSGFLFQGVEPAKLRAQLDIADDTQLVGVTARKWLNQTAQEQYEIELAQALDVIIASHSVEVVFIPQVTSIHNNDDDRQVSRSIAARMKHATQVHVMEDDYSHTAVKAMYDELDYIIGTRFHSVIFSLTSYVPAIAIEYEHKTSGIMNDMKLGQWTLKIEDVKSATITALFDALVEGRDEYADHLKKVLPAYVERASEAIELVDAKYQQLPDTTSSPKH